MLMCMADGESSGESPDKVKPRNIPMTNRLWWDLEATAARAKQPGERLDRTAVIRDLVRWYTRQPGAKMPVRPPVAKDGEDG